MFESGNHMSIFSDIVTLLVSIYRDCVLLISPSTNCESSDLRVPLSTSLPSFLEELRWTVSGSITLSYTVQMSHNNLQFNCTNTTIFTTYNNRAMGVTIKIIKKYISLSIFSIVAIHSNFILNMTSETFSHRSNV